MREEDIIKLIENYLSKFPRVLVNVNYYDNRVEKDDSTFVESAVISDKED